MNTRYGRIITFYSYKGGVGRTMTLASVAVSLARMGRRVLCVDWDLEAPGLHAYFRDWLPGGPRAGLLELVRGEIGDWREAVHTVKLPGDVSLDLIPAGRTDDHYTARLHEVDWRERYAAGFAEALEDMRDGWLASYDLVLCDSRTGLSDLGGISTIHLPNLLVVLFTPNAQSVDGVLRVARGCIAQQARLPFSRAPLRVVPVPTRLDQAEYQQHQQWKKEFEECLGPFVRQWRGDEDASGDVGGWFDAVSIPYVPYFAYGEKIPAIVEPDPGPKEIGYGMLQLARALAANLEVDERTWTAPERTWADVEALAATLDGAAMRRVDGWLAEIASHTSAIDNMVSAVTGMSAPPRVPSVWMNDVTHSGTPANADELKRDRETEPRAWRAYAAWRLALAAQERASGELVHEIMKAAATKGLADQALLQLFVEAVVHAGRLGKYRQELLLGARPFFDDPFRYRQWCATLPNG